MEHEWRNGVLIITPETLEELEADPDYTVEANGMSGTNYSYYLFWVTDSDGNEIEINVKF